MLPCGNKAGNQLTGVSFFKDASPLPSGATSALGNGVVLLVYCRKRNKLRPPELMTINLAVCDLGFSLLGVPFFITSWY